MKLPLDLWQSYATKLLPTVPTDSVQYQETRRAFMAAIGSFIGQLTSDELTSQPDEFGMAFMEQCHAQLQGFQEDIMAGKV